MKAAAPTISGGEASGESESGGQDLSRAPGPKFVEEVIGALIELDAEHLEALAAAAEQFRREAMARLAPAEVAEMAAKMRLLSALLAETRRNLWIFAATVGEPDPLGYKPGRRPWAD